MQEKLTTFIENHPPILPVVSITTADAVIPLVDALVRGGINAIEVTLRTDAGIEAIKRLRDQRPSLFLCAGSVTQREQIESLAALEVDLIITPGLSKPLLDTAGHYGLSLLPGISTASDILLGLEYNLRFFKFFPAEAMGGIHYLNTISEPFPNCRFCPTGGINPENIGSYLSSEKVVFVGGSWLANKKAIDRSDWGTIEANTRMAVQKAALF